MTRRLIFGLQAGLAGKDASLVVSALLALLLIAAIGMQEAPPVEPSPAEPSPAEATPEEMPEETIETGDAPGIDPAMPPAPATITLPPPPRPAEAKPRSPAVDPAPPVELPVPDEPLAIEATLREPEPLADSPAETAVATAGAGESPPPMPAEKARRLSAEAHRQGRALLILVESGEGPSISIDWPTSAASRASLIDRLRRCHGMELALLVGDGSIVRLEDPPGRSGSFDLDRWSGFLRLPSGGLTAAEEEVRDRLAALHGPGRLVRLFPRRVDSGILGGLAQMLGDDYRRGHDIRLAYQWDQGRIVLGLLRLDGEPHQGRLILPEVRPCP